DPQLRGLLQLQGDRADHRGVARPAGREWRRDLAAGLDFGHPAACSVPTSGSPPSCGATTTLAICAWYRAVATPLPGRYLSRSIISTATCRSTLPRRPRRWSRATR